MIANLGTYFSFRKQVEDEFKSEDASKTHKVKHWEDISSSFLVFVLIFILFLFALQKVIPLLLLFLLISTFRRTIFSSSDQSSENGFNDLSIGSEKVICLYSTSGKLVSLS